MKTRGVSAVIGLIVALCMFLVNCQANAEAHHQRARVRGCLPVYNYHQDHAGAAGSVVCVLVEDPVKVSWPRTRFSRTTAGGLVATEGVDQVRRKKFSPPPEPVTAGPVRLDQIGVFLYDTGDIVCTGRIADQTVLKDKEKPRGVNATIIIRAYAGIQANQGGLNGAAMVWRREKRLWARNGLPDVVSLLPSSVGSHAELQRHFGEITHLELELRYEKGR